MGWLATLGASILGSSTRVNTTPAQVIDTDADKGLSGEEITLLTTGFITLLGLGVLTFMIARSGK